MKVWMVVCIILCALALSRGFALHDQMILELRELAIRHGLYEYRRPFQGILLLLSSLLLVFIQRNTWQELSQSERLVAWGVTLSFSITFLRMVSFHYVDQFIQFTLFGSSVASLLELIGISIIALAVYYSIGEGRIRLRS